MKVLAIFAVLIALPVVVQIPRDGSQKSTESHCQQYIGKDSIPACIATVQELQIPPQAQPTKQESTFREKVAGPQTWSNWAVVIVAIWAGCIARRSFLISRQQTVATRRAAIATRKSADAALKTVKLQEATFKQWVTVDHWWCDVRSDTSEEIKLKIGFSVCNPTKYPLTITRVRVDMSGRGNSDDTLDFVVAPEKDYESSILLTLKEEADRRIYRHAGVIFTITVMVRFNDVLTEPREQVFVNIVKINPGGITPVEFDVRHNT